MVGCRIKILSIGGQRDLLILTGRMLDSFQNNKIADEHKIIKVIDVMRRTETLTRYNCNEHSDRGGMASLS